MKNKVRLGNLFDIGYGQKIYHSKSHLEDKKGSTLLISSKGTDNGCYGFFNIKPKYNPPIITVPSTGSIGQAFVQTESCCVDDNCLVLIPKEDMSIEFLLYICVLIRNEKWRFKYGRQLTPGRISEFQVDMNLSIDYEDIRNELLSAIDNIFEKF